jgi:transposase InsO family protein
VGALTTEERGELGRLRRENRTLRMERDILKKRRPSSRRRTREVRVHRCREGRRPGPAAVPHAPGVARRLLRLAGAPAGAAGASGRLRLEIAAIHAESRQRFGSPRIHAELADRGCRTSRKRVARLMRVRGLAARPRRRLPQGLLHHSDRGSQYASGDYQRVLAQHGIVCSMSRRGDCWDNAVAESP